MGKFCELLTELSAHDTSIFSFQDNNLSKSQQIFTKLDMYLTLWRSELGLLLGTFPQFLTELFSMTQWRHHGIIVSLFYFSIKACYGYS